MSLFPVILSGGSGTRLWPLSRGALPKQLLSLHSSRTMIQETVLRARLAEAGAPILLCNDDHRFLVAEQMQEIGVAPGAIVLEPQGRNTAPAAAVAALVALEKDSDAIVALLPSDHVVGDEEAFRRTMAIAARAAEAGNIVTFGMTPTAPETGYGYIQKGEPLAGIEGAFKVRGFKEKPNAATAQSYLDDGSYFWNGGMFVFRADVMLAEIERLEPSVMPAVRDAVAKAARDLDFIRLDAGSFGKAPNIAIDYAVMERTDRAVVVPCSIQWNDVGSWSALWEVCAHDAADNVLQGDVVAHDTRSSLVHSEGRLTAVVGIRDMVVVTTKDAVLVADKRKTQDVKAIVDKLKAAERSEPVEHAICFRPWGSYEVVERGENFLVNHILIKPGSRISLHMHHHRVEHWIVLQGTAQVTCGEKSIVLHENESAYIPLGEKHRLENPGRVPLRLIEVQSGPYLGADDITRFEDYYGGGRPAP